MRPLIPLVYVPIIHSEADLGALGKVVAERAQDLHPEPAALARRRLSIDAMWQLLRTRILGMPLPWASTRVYQDGLPICGRELDIVRDLAQEGSHNFSLLRELAERGATVMGTEEPTLLVREYRRIQRLVELTSAPKPDHEAILALRREGDDLLALRDIYIARRISDTLAADEHGLIFIGLQHRVDDLLAGSYLIHHVIHNLPFAAEPSHEAGRPGDP